MSNVIPFKLKKRPEDDFVKVIDIGKNGLIVDIRQQLAAVFQLSFEYQTASSSAASAALDIRRYIHVVEFVLTGVFFPFVGHSAAAFVSKNKETDASLVIQRACLGELEDKVEQGGGEVVQDFILLVQDYQYDTGENAIRTMIGEGIDPNTIEIVMHAKTTLSPNSIRTMIANMNKLALNNGGFATIAGGEYLVAIPFSETSCTIVKLQTAFPLKESNK